MRGFGGMLMKNRVEGVKNLEKRTRNRVSTEFTNMKYTPISCKGIIKEVDPDLSKATTILEKIQSECGRNMIQVKRRKKIGEFQNTSYVNSVSVVVVFTGSDVAELKSVIATLMHEVSELKQQTVLITNELSELKQQAPVCNNFQLDGESFENIIKEIDDILKRF
ncbi:hypothetical protein QE152_g26625 [Popillia japonica]|uniref:Uncharacterized protein n=1 Tax=Popillia japonica TaxID=7064 RepID=A0AAW1JWE9_POPJA